MESHKVTKKDAQVYMTGYRQAVEVCCGLLKEVVGYRKSIFGRSEQRVFDDEFIGLFRERAYDLFELKVMPIELPEEE